MKKKKHLSEHMPASRFIMLMGLIYAIGTGIGTIATIALFQLNISWTYLYPALSLLPFALTAIGESLLLKVQFRWKAHQWLIASLIGIAGIYVWFMTANFAIYNFMSALTAGWIFRRMPALILALAQLVVLRRYVKRAWLWVVGGVGFSIINIVIFSSFWSAVGTQFNSPVVSSIVTSTLASGIQGVVLAMVMTVIVRLSMKDERDSIAEIDDDVHTTNDLTDEQSHHTGVTPQDLSEWKQNASSN